MFKKITIIDNVILFPEQFVRLGACADSVELGLGLSTEEIERRLRVFEKSGAKVNCITECGSERLSESELVDVLVDTDCLITCWQPITRGALEKLAGRLKLVLYWTDITRIDREAAEDLGIVVDNVPDYGTQAVSEYVFACLLEMFRRPSYHVKRARSGSFDYENFKHARKGVFVTDDIFEETLNGKRLGIAGFGRIGQRVGTIAKCGFGMDAKYFSRTRKEEAEKLGIRYSSLDEMFETCDIITAHFPSSVTTPVIDRQLLNRLSPSSVFINTGSASAVDYEVLLELLEAGKFRAILDVHPGIPDRKRLNKIDNLIYTYRTAWYTKQSLARKGEILVGKLERYSQQLGR